MLYTIERAVRSSTTGRMGCGHLAKRAMKCDFSWEKSAKEYAALYEEVLGKGAAM